MYHDLPHEPRPHGVPMHNGSKPGKRAKRQENPEQREAKEMQRKTHEQARKREEERLKKQEEIAHNEEDRRHKAEDSRRKADEDRRKAAMEKHEKSLENPSRFEGADEFEETEMVHRNFNERARTVRPEHDAHRSGHADMDFSEDEETDE